jgi:hypothetical protein
MRAAVVLLVFALGGVAYAQPALTEPQPIVFDHLKPAVPEYKNPATATGLAIGGSLVGLGTIYLGAHMGNGDTPIMMIGGLISVFGPSMGDWWASSSARFTPGFGIRVAGAAIAGLGFARAIDTNCSGGTCDAPLENKQSNLLIGIGGVTVLGGMVLDIATAGKTARKHNSHLNIGPQLVKSASGTLPGLGVDGRF